MSETWMFPLPSDTFAFLGEHHDHEIVIRSEYSSVPDQVFTPTKETKMNDYKITYCSQAEGKDWFSEGLPKVHVYREATYLGTVVDASPLEVWSLCGRGQMCQFQRLGSVIYL